jgi:hypothetical protein
MKELLLGETKVHQVLLHVIPIHILCFIVRIYPEQEGRCQLPLKQGGQPGVNFVGTSDMCLTLGSPAVLNKRTSFSLFIALYPTGGGNTIGPRPVFSKARSGERMNLLLV